MIKAKIILFIFILLPLLCFGQRLRGRCDTLILDEHSRNILNVHELTIKEYLLKRGVDHSAIANRDSLKLLRTLICNDSVVMIFDTIQGKVIEIGVKKGYKYFDASEYLMPRDRGEFSNSLLFYNGQQAPFGFMYEDTLVSTIKLLSVKVDGEPLYLPRLAYEDLLFPNFCNIFVNITPINAFFSKKNDKLYLYIFGEHRRGESVSHFYGFYYSYMAKLIIDLKDGYKSRVVVRGEVLCYYNWSDCFDFIGF